MLWKAFMPCDFIELLALALLLHIDHFHLYSMYVATKYVRIFDVQLTFVMHLQLHRYIYVHYIYVHHYIRTSLHTYVTNQKN